MKRKIIPNFGNVSSRILSLLLALIMVLGMVPGVALAADSDTTVYLRPNSNWLEASARFAVYYWNDSGSDWGNMTDPDGDCVYEASIPAGYSNIIFVRMNPSSTTNSWDTKWNQTSNLTIPTDVNNCYSITDGSWENGSWSTYTFVEPTFIVAGTSGLCGSDWDPSDTANRMTYNSETSLYEITYSNIAAGSYELKVTNGSWASSWGKDGGSDNYTFTTDVLSNVKITFNASTKEINYTATPVTYSVTFNGTNVTSNGAATATAGSDYTATLTAAEGYTLPETVTVTVGGAEISGYTYTGGLLTIPATSVTGDIVITAAGVEIPTVDYYLIGYINGANYGCEEDYQNLGDYKFVNGTLTATFTQDSYVFVKTGDNANWYLAESYCTDASVTLASGNSEKLLVPANLEVTFTLVDNGDGTLTLSYTFKIDPNATYIVAGSAGLVGTEWEPAADSNKMTFNEETGLYEITYANVSAGSYEFKVTDGSWDNAWPSSNYPLYITEESNVTIKFDVRTKSVSVATEKVTDDPTPSVPTEKYYVAGDEALTSKNWVADGDEMAYNSTSGLYEITYSNVAAGTYNLKVTDGTWDNAWGDNGSNYTFVVSAACDVTVTFDSNSKTVTVSGESVTKPVNIEVTSMFAVGNGAGSWMNGQSWITNADANKMTETSENVYEITFENVPAGTSYQFKFAANGDWTHSWGGGGAAGEAVYNGQNIPLTLTGTSDVTLRIDMTGYNHNTKNGATYSVTVTDASSGGGETPTTVDYYLVGFLNGADYGCNDDYANLGQYKFVNGTLTATFTQDSYVFVKTGDNANWYMAESFCQDTTVTLKNTTTGTAEKMFVPGNVEVTFTLVENADDTLTLSYTTDSSSSGGSQTPTTVDYYLVGFLNGADYSANDYKFENGTLTATFTGDNYVYVKTGDNQNYMAAAYSTGPSVTLLKSGNEKMLVPGGVEVTFTLTENPDDTLTLSYTTDSSSGGGSQTPATVDYYLVGYLNNADNYGTDYKFVDGKLTATFTQDTYVCIKDSNDVTYMSEAYCTDTSVVLKNNLTGTNEKMKVPTGVDLVFTLAENGDGTLTLSYAIDIPEIPEGYNTVTIHFLKPTNWGSSINAYIWTAEGALTGYDAYNTWPGSAIPANADKAGWYDITVGTENPQAFNFIFNDGSSQTADLTTGTVTGPTELWVVDGTVYTTAPLEWTHYTATIHFQKPANWGDTVNAYAWTDNGALLLDPWPGTVTSASSNSGWYNTTIRVKIGEALNFIFNDGANQTGDIKYGNVNGNIELWIDGSGNSVSAPSGWIDESRTIHLPGTLPGPSWDAASNLMTYDPTLGLYVITFENVTAGTYYYKVAVNGSWNENYGYGGAANGNDISVVVPSTQDVTFWYSDMSHRVVCSVSYDINADITLSGTGIPEGTKLTDPNLSGLFTTTVELSAGTYSNLKIAYGTTEVSFNEFTLSSGKAVTFFFDPSTGMGYHNGSDDKVDTTYIRYDSRDLTFKDPFGAVAVGEEVTFSIITGLDATGVALVIKGLPAVEMSYVVVEDTVKVWTCTTSFASIGEYQYYFAITNGSDMVFYCDDNYNSYYKKGDYGTGTVRDINNIFPYDLVVYEAGYETPDWMKNAVIYQIFPDRFFDGDESNNQAQIWARGTVDYEYITDWYLLPENPEMADDPNYPENAHNGDGQWSNEIYGGDLQGIVEKIDYLKALGVNVIYLNPVFWSISNHRYDAVSYTEIDPILGTLGDFEELVAVAEENDMHIILDGVFNHVSDDSVYFDRYYKFLPDAAEKYDGKIGAYPYWAYVYDLVNDEGMTQTEAEAAAVEYFTAEYGITDYSYTEWFAVENKLTANKDTIGLRAGKYVYTYEGWWGYDSMPVVKSTNGSEYQTGNWAEEILSHENENSVNAYWISKGMDGWRLDVANEVSDETWQNFRDSVKALDSEAVIIGEIWSDATRYLMGDMYDSVMNYVFRDAVAGFARGYLINRDDKTQKYDSDLTADEAMTILEILRERYPEEAFYAMMNLVASHDTSRILSYLDDVEDDRYQKDIEHAFPTYEDTSDEAKQLQYVVAFLQFTYAGAPTIYYGDEIGMVGGDDPDDRRAFEWGKGNQEIVEWYAKLAAIRAVYPALRTGSVEPFSTGDDDVMGFIRRDADNTIMVLANRAASATTIAYEGTWVDLISGNTYTDTITVPAYRGVILVAEDEVKEIADNTAGLAPAYDPTYIVKARCAHEYDEGSVSGPTCGDEGYTLYTCIKNCGYSYKVDYVPATGDHTWSDWTQTNAPTTSSEGEERRDCIHCDAYETQPIPVITVTLYTITKAECKNGSVTAQAIMAAKGSTIKVSAVPAEGYKLVKLVVTDTSGNEIEVVDGKFKMPASNVTVSATFVYDLPYTDVADDAENYAAIAYMYETGLMIGTSTEEYIFNGDMTMTRAQIAMILYRLSGEPAVEYAGTFTDAPEGAWYTAAVEWAHSAGIVVGVNETEFTPAREITVNELAALIYRYAQCQLTGSCTSTEDDWTVEFAAAMTWCVENGVLSEDVSASEIATRYLAAEMFYSVYSLLNK